MAVYPREVIYSETGDVILLKFVESFTFHEEEGDLIVDKLRNDFRFGIRTISGKEYIISVKYISNKVYNIEITLSELVNAIYDKWIHINKS